MQTHFAPIQASRQTQLDLLALLIRQAADTLHPATNSTAEARRRAVDTLRETAAKLPAYVEGLPCS